MKLSWSLFVILSAGVALLEGAPRQKRTLGLITTAGQTLGSSIQPIADAASNVIGSAGAAASSALSVASAVKPLIILGIGKYALWNLIRRPGGLSFQAGAGGNNLGLTAGYNSAYPAESVVYAAEPSFIQSNGEWTEEPVWKSVEESRPTWSSSQEYSKW